MPTGHSAGATHSRGILSNRLYVGEALFDRSKYVRNPDTGRKVRRKGENPITVLRPDLRIIDDETWQAAERIRLGREKPAGQPRLLRQRSDGLLSGMVNCGVWGGHMIVVERSRHGTTRAKCAKCAKCAAAYHRSQCDHKRLYDLTRLESAVLDGLITLLAAPI